MADFTPRPSSARPTTPDGGAGVGVSVTSDDAGFKVTTQFRLRIRCVTVGCPEPVGGSKRGSWLLSTRISYIDWLLRRVDPDIVSTIGFTDVQAKAVYDISARQQIEFALVGGDADYRNDQARAANQVNRADSTSFLSSLRWRYNTTRVVFSQRLSVVTNDFRNTGAVGQEGAIGTARAT